MAGANAPPLLLLLAILLPLMVSSSSSSSSSSSVHRLPPAFSLSSSSPPRTLRRPSAASTTIAAATAPPSESDGDDVAVVGCGVLGTSLCRMLLSHPSFSSRSVVGITRGTSRHDEIRGAVLEQLGVGTDDEEREEDGCASRGGRFRLLTMEEATRDGRSGRTYRDVVFCAPPSGFDDYPGAIDAAAETLWSGPDGGGSFAFTSSGVVYGDGSGGVVDEASPTSPDSESNPRVSRMINAERNALSRGGCAIRLAGLYTLERGAHNYWLERFGTRTGTDKAQGRGDGIVNLLHYDDAAGAVMAALVAGPGVNSGRTFLISDGSPTSRRGICESALVHPRYGGFGMPSFASDDDDDDGKGKDEGAVGGRSNNARGKVYDGRWSNDALRWKPTYPSFDEFMTSSSPFASSLNAAAAAASPPASSSKSST